MAGRIVIAGSESPLGRRLADRYAADGNAVGEVMLSPGADLERVAADLGPEPVDLLILADDFSPPDRDPAAVTRAELAAGLERLAFAPFRLANLLRPALAAAGGRAVLVSRVSAMMERADPRGRFLERPFRAAAHQLWRCLSFEWRDDGIDCIIIALDDPGDGVAIARLPETIAAAKTGGDGVILIDGRGRPLPW